MDTTRPFPRPHQAGPDPRQPGLDPAAMAEFVRDVHRMLGEIHNLLGHSRKSHYTIEEIAELTGRASYTVRSWVKQGKLHAVRVTGTGPKGRLLVPREQLERLIGRGLGDALPATLGSEVDGTTGGRPGR
ncbi:helix-turn-helix domain-containing protein [Isosphaeraceae bacterium EP7]